MKSICLKICIVFTILITVNTLKAQTYYSMHNGNWNTNIWSTTSHMGPNCLCQPPGGCAFSNTAYIYNNITVNGCAHFGLTGGGKIYLQPAANFIVNNDFIISSASYVVVPVGDTLTVNGNLTLGGSSIMKVNGFLKVTGTITLTGMSQVVGFGSGIYSSLNVSPGACWCFNLAYRELLSFNAEKNESNEVNLAWETVTESGTDYFIIEKTNDQINYVPVAKIKAAGYSSELQNYQITDNTPYIGLSYYRLTITNENGNSERYPLTSVNINPSPNSEFTVFPNPSDGQSISISTSGKNTGSKINISVYDIYGRTISQNSFIVNQETTNLSEQLALPQLGPGMYFIKAIINNTNYSLPFSVK